MRKEKQEWLVFKDNPPEEDCMGGHSYRKGRYINGRGSFVGGTFCVWTSVLVVFRVNGL